MSFEQKRALTNQSALGMGRLLDFNQDYDCPIFSPEGTPRYFGFSLPTSVILLLVHFNTEDYPKLLKLSKGWNRYIKETFREYIANAKLENNFNAHYGKQLQLLKGTLSATPL